MEKIAIVIQRFGKTVNGGAEVHAKQIADLLKDRYKITVITSCAESYTTWEPTFSEGSTTIDDIEVIRLANTSRDESSQKKMAKKVKYHPQVYLQRKFYSILKPDYFDKTSKNLIDNGTSWLKSQGPFMPELENWIDKNQNKFTAFIFFSSLYHPTYVGLNSVGNKSILIPLLHNETCSFFPPLSSNYKKAKFIFFNTKSEKKLAESIYCYDTSKGSIVAVGIDHTTPEQTEISVKPYIIYIGRISKEKGCQELIEWFLKWKEHNQDLQLYLVGNTTMEIPNHPDVINKGFVSDSEKEKFLNNALALVIPSKHESLSLVTLESFFFKVPVIGNEHCETIKDHLTDSNAGLLYSDYKTFSMQLDQIYSNKQLRQEMGENGQKYVQTHYDWNTVKKKFIAAIESISNEQIAS